MSPRQKEPLTYEHALLGFLLQKPMHAYALHLTLMESPLGNVWRVKQSALYAMLTRLASEGLIDAGTEDITGRGKRVLSLTVLGNASFKEWCVTPVPHPRDMRMEFLAKLYFLERLPIEFLQQLIEAQQLQALDWFEPVDGELTPYAKRVRLFRNGQITAIQEWLRTLKQIG
ncbi:MAG: PadR family transcriptional regulator [Chloroflexales bacterium]|nr:PadR family transcriptional regulator [Chloroflexales bacterium]